MWQVLQSRSALSSWAQLIQVGDCLWLSCTTSSLHVADKEILAEQ